MRDRAWRRYMEEKIVISRLGLLVGSSWYFIDINGNSIQNPMIKDYINTKTFNMFKTYKTDKYDTNYKVKYSPNKSKSYYRDKNKKGTRELYKIELLNILKRHGVK